MKIAITGGIAVGKSTIINELFEAGIQSLSEDKILHTLYNDKKIIEEITSIYGTDILTEDKKSIDRVKLSKKFSEFTEIEKITIPYVQSIVDNFHIEHEGELTIVESPTLFEMDKKYNLQNAAKYDLILCLYCSDEKVQKHRAIERKRQKSPEMKRKELVEHYKKIKNLQLPNYEKIRQSHYAFDTLEAIEEVAKKVKDTIIAAYNSLP